MNSFNKSQTIIIAVLIIFAVLIFVTIIYYISKLMRIAFTKKERNSKLEILTPRDESIVIIYENGAVYS
jgi:flagellar biogenesis protein FliO